MDDFDIFYCNFTIQSFFAMAVGSGQTYTASEVLHILQEREECEDSVRNLVSSLDLDAESEDGDNPEGDGTLEDGSVMLIPPEFLNPGAMELIFHTINATSPAERDSLLLEESEFSAQTFFKETTIEDTGLYANDSTCIA